MCPQAVRSGRFEPGLRVPLAQLLPELRRHGLAGVSPNGVLGDPTGASADAGERLLASWSAQLLHALQAWP